MSLTLVVVSDINRVKSNVFIPVTVYRKVVVSLKHTDIRYQHLSSTSSKSLKFQIMSVLMKDRPGDLTRCVFSSILPGEHRTFKAMFVQFRWSITLGVAKVQKEASFRERKVPFAKGRFCLRKEDMYGNI